MDTHIFVFMPFIALSLFLVVVGLMKRDKDSGMFFLIVIGGSMITFWGVMTDNLIMGTHIQSIDTSSSTITATYADTKYEFTGWHKILFALTGALIMVTGGIMWKNK